MKQIDFRVTISGWDNSFGVANRVVFPLATDKREVTLSVPFGQVRVGKDEAEGTFDQWLTDPSPALGHFEQGWNLRPREVSDWIKAAVSDSTQVVLSSSVGVFDWVDASGA